MECSQWVGYKIMHEGSVSSSIGGGSVLGSGSQRLGSLGSLSSGEQVSKVLAGCISVAYQYRSPSTVIVPGRVGDISHHLRSKRIFRRSRPGPVAVSAAYKFGKTRRAGCQRGGLCGERHVSAK